MCFECNRVKFLAALQKLTLLLFAVSFSLVLISHSLLGFQRYFRQRSVEDTPDLMAPLQRYKPLLCHNIDPLVIAAHWNHQSVSRSLSNISFNLKKREKKNRQRNICSLNLKLFFSFSLCTLEYSHCLLSTRCSALPLQEQ